MSDQNTAAPTSSDAPKPLWGGRFSAAPTGELERFGASLPFDKRMWRQDIRGSKAHAAMLAHQGVISEQDAEKIRAGLDEIAGQIERGEFVFDVDRDEDIHMAIERVLTERIGAAGGRLHTGRSRNDQTAVDTHMIVRDLADEIIASLVKLEAVLLERAEDEFGVVMPGYTHMQPAQPVLLSHHLLAYFWMFSRDLKRVRDARAAANVCPLGAAALAGIAVAGLLLKHGPNSEVADCHQRIDGVPGRKTRLAEEAKLRVGRFHLRCARSRAGMDARAIAVGEQRLPEAAGIPDQK